MTRMASGLPPIAAVMDLQQTLRRPVSLTGIGLHSGEPVEMTASPAGADTGIVFRAADGTLIPANADHVVDTNSATTVGAFGVRVRTIEHLMAAAAALGIDNALVDVKGPEVPAADGSAQPFLELLREGGRVTLPAPRRPIVITEPIRVGTESRWLEVLPADALRVSYTLDRKSTRLNSSHMSISYAVFCLKKKKTIKQSLGQAQRAKKRNGAQKSWY